MPSHPADMYFVLCCCACDQYHDGRQSLSELDMDQFHANRMVYDNEDAQW